MKLVSIERSDVRAPVRGQNFNWFKDLSLESRHSLAS